MKAILIVLTLTMTSHLFAGACGFDTRTTPAEAQSHLNEGNSKCLESGSEYEGGKHASTQLCRCFEVNKSSYEKVIANAEKKSVTSFDTPSSVGTCDMNRVSGKTILGSGDDNGSDGNIINQK